MTLLRTLTVLAVIAGSHCAGAATFIVDTSSDAALGDCNDAVAADCSLRGAIVTANALPGADAIAFDLPIADPGYQAGTQHWRIDAASSLPNIMEGLSIDGFTQAGATPNGNPPYAGIAHTLKIELRGPGNAADGLIAYAPLSVRGLAVNHWHFAIFHFNPGPNIVEGNYIGTDISGQLAAANDYGIALGGDVRIGGATPAQGNVISANRNHGLANQYGLTSVRIQGNIIGASADLTSVPGRQDFGAYLLSAQDTLIGGAMAAEGNVISGNGFAAVEIVAGASQAQGLAPHVRIQGNRIGSGIDGRALGNGRASSYPAILVSLGGYCRTLIGGSAPGEGNAIVHNANAGIAIGSCWNAPILGNTFHGNGGLAIDLAGSNAFDGATPNDTDDADAAGNDPSIAAGGNRFQNFPVLTLPAGFLPSGGDSVTVDYTLDSLPGNSSYPITVQFHRAACGGGSAELLAEAEIDEINAQQPLQFTLNIGANVLPLTLLAIDAQGNTSEFGPVFGETLFADGLEQDPASFSPGSCR
ncbi:MAG: hypothetical protein IPH76_12335 [Xanthomonadales bacterium]|nr:hypothetical protein [Xanthomonadales bacterium]